MLKATTSVTLVDQVAPVETKFCGTCKEEKPITEFNLRGSVRPQHRQHSCKECVNKVIRAHKRKISSLVKRWKMFKGCQMCGFKAKHSCQLDLDHIVPKGSKSKDRQAINTSWSKPRLKVELSKCQVLCSNCHRLKTYQDGTMFQPKD
jgi:hypothetical protein